VTDPEEPRPSSASEPTDSGANWVRVERSSPTEETPESAPDDDAVGSWRWDGEELFTPIPPIDPERLTELQSETDYPEPVPETKVSPLARIRSSAHAEHVTTIDRLRDGQAALSDRLRGWLITIMITGIAFAVRFVNLGYPNKLIFDETYYAKDAWTLWKFGYEHEWPSREVTDVKVAAGDVDLYRETAAFIVHPPVGKWLIGLGEQLFGMNSFGWRFMPLVFGTLLVLMTIRMARRLSRSTLIGAIAGILLTFDGLSFVMSRIALLDIFQAFFLVAAVAAVVADRDYYRRKLADKLDARGIPDFGGRFGPIIWLRPWRLVAGVMFGLAIGTKWNSVFVLAAIGLLSVVWDVGARRLAGADFKSLLALIVDGVPAFVRMVVVAAVVYLASWWGWLTTAGGWDRDWGHNNPDHPWVRAVGEMWASLMQYHVDIYNFHNSDYMRNVATHTYDAHPGGWLLMVRPTGIDAINDIKAGVDGCTVAADQTCMRVISAMGTPTLWWFAAIALLVGLVWWIGGRDWRFGAPIVAAMSTYIFWFPNADRPVFFFYAICIIPFTVTVLAMVLGLILGPKKGPRRRRGAIIVGVAIALVILHFAYLYPVLTDGLLPSSEYYARMWLLSWI
jgi:dolichyl-phosphate-mannose-protein mannosyltransferase